jgi:hypothetical protein
VLEFVLRLAILLVVLGLVVWDIRRERDRGVDPPLLLGVAPGLVKAPGRPRPQEERAKAL